MKLPEIPVLSPILDLLRDKSVVMFLGAVIGTIAIGYIPDVRYHEAVMVLAVGGALLLTAKHAAFEFLGKNADLVGIAFQGLIDALEEEIGEIPDEYEKKLVERMVSILKGLAGDSVQIDVK